MRTSDKNMNRLLKSQIEKTFAQAIGDIRDPIESLSIIRHFFTKSELETFSKRLAIAYWLKKGRSYSNIKENLKVSSATIASVQNMMKKRGFDELLKKVEAEEWANIWSTKIKKFVGAK